MINRTESACRSCEGEAPASILAFGLGQAA